MKKKNQESQVQQENNLKFIVESLLSIQGKTDQNFKEFKQNFKELKQGNQELKQDNLELKQGNLELKQDNLELKQDNRELKQNQEKTDLKIEELKQGNLEIKERLDRIEKNTIVIRDVVINDFNGISEQTKLKLEEEGEKVVKIKEQIIESDSSTLWDKKSKQYHSPSAKKYRKENKPFSISELIESYNPVQEDGFYLGSDGLRYTPNGYNSPCGIWVSGIITLILDYKLTRRYPEELRGLVDALVAFWIYEREDCGRMY